MLLRFSQFCDLLDALEDVSRHDPPYLLAECQRRYKGLIHEWFASHRICLSSPVIDPLVLLSSLFPAKRTDRIYGIQAKRLSHQLRRCLSLSHGRWQQLDQYLKPGRGDLGDCVERILRQAENPTSKKLTLQEIDDALNTVAAHCHFSGRAIRQSFSGSNDGNQLILDCIYKSLQSREAKWFTRLLLKDFYAVNLETYASMMYSYIDPGLSLALHMYNDFQSAIARLKSSPAYQTNVVAINGRTQQLAYGTCLLNPQIGVKVGSPYWVKAKSGIDHALSLIGRRQMSLERKHDGEYCQIHVDLGRGVDCIQIFSKSGKDSTEDRKSVLATLKQGLRIGHPNQGFLEKCILEGELVVWSDRDNGILEFHKIRKHVPRSGVYIGTTEDSQPYPFEHLMIIFYDILLLDGDPVLHRAQKDRRWILEQIVLPIRGRIALTESHKADFSTSEGAQALKKLMARALASRWEGLVLKPTHEPYFGLGKAGTQSQGWWIKLKKDCIQGYGDSADFAVVGAGYHARRAQDIKLPNIKWTHFFIGCLKNRQAVQHTAAKAEFLVVDCVTNCIAKDDLQILNQQGVFVALDIGHPSVANLMDLEFVYMDCDLPRMTTVFWTPFVSDVAGSGFDRGPNRSVFTLRFPRVLKIRFNSDWRNCIDLSQLQTMAEEARKMPEASLQDEIAMWEENLGRPWKAPAEFTTSRSSEAQNTVQPAREGRPLTSHTLFNRRTKKTTAPAFVRVDTKEIRVGEDRASDGQIVMRPSSKDPQSSNASLPISPSSRSSMERYVGVSCQVKLRKRDSGSQPLQEIENVARPAALTGPGTPTDKDAPQPDCLELVRQIAIGHDGPRHHTSSKVKRFVVASPFQETTSDECSSAASSQIRTLFAAASQPTPSRTKLVLGTHGLVTAPSSAEALGCLKLPDVEKVIAFVDTANKPSRALNSFYHTNKPLLKPFLRPLHRFQASTADAALNPAVDVIFLVNARNVESATEDLLAIAARMPQLRKSVNVWDWHLLEMLIDPGRQCNVEQKALKDLLVARMEYAGGLIAPNTGTVRVLWRDGAAEELPLDHLEHLENLGTKEAERRQEHKELRKRRLQQSATLINDTHTSVQEKKQRKRGVEGLR